MTDTLNLNSITLNTNSSVCTFIKAKINPLPLIPDETVLKKCLSFLESFQKVKNSLSSFKATLLGSRNENQERFFQRIQ